MPSKQVPAAPRHPAKALTVARLRMLGATQAEAAEAAGVALRTVGVWEGASWWPDFLEQARTSVHDQMEAYAYRCLLEAVRDGDAQSARWMLERLRPSVWGSVQRAELSGPGGAPLVPTPRPALDADALASLTAEQLERRFRERMGDGA